MHFIIDSIWIAGAILIATATVHALIATFDVARGAWHRTERRAREAELLQLRVDAARRRHAHEQEQGAWSGWRKFVIQRKVLEAEGICSFYLAPHDKKPLPAFKPGQFLTFRLDAPGQSKPVVRCYSLSNCWEKEQYRISIKKACAPREGAPPGVASCFFHERLSEGDILDVRSPAGNFCLDPAEDAASLVLLAGGIGITPLLCMLNGLLAEGPLRRQVYLFWGVRNGREHPFKQHLERIARENEKLRLQICYSNPVAGDIADKDYHHAGRIDLDLLKKVLPSSNFLYYLCGPPAMMESMVQSLKTWGVPEEHIRFEAFGPKSVAGVADVTSKAAPVGLTAAGVEVVFEKTGQTCRWTPSDGTLLDLAERSGIHIESGCRAGNCGTCAVAVKDGDVSYQTRPAVEPEKGSCLTCCSIPTGRLVLNA